MLYDFFGASSWGPLNIIHGLGIEKIEVAFISAKKDKEIPSRN